MSLNTTAVRQHDGFWMRQGEPLGTHVFAALTGPNIDPGSFASRWPRLWLHPWATHQLELDVPSLAESGGEQGRVI